MKRVQCDYHLQSHLNLQTRRENQIHHRHSNSPIRYNKSRFCSVQQKREISRSFQACQVTTDLQNDLYNNHVKFEEETIPVAAFADTKFIRLLYDPSPGLEGMNLHKAILNEMNHLLQKDESL